MIAEEYNNNYLPSVSIPPGTTVDYILTCLKNTVPFFKSAYSQADVLKPLNENKLTQIFVEQIDIQLRKISARIGVKNQYSDIFFGTKGIPDFYFHALEEGRTSVPFFVTEAKRLPAPTSSIATEYVIGATKNGGIERFKIGKHGTGFIQAGMIGFIEENDGQYWITEVNTWIKDLSKSNSDWNLDEILATRENGKDFMLGTSIVHRGSAVSDLELFHFWMS